MSNVTTKVLSRSAWASYRAAHALLGKEVLDAARQAAVLVDSIHVCLDSEIRVSGFLLNFGCPPFFQRHEMRVETAKLLSVALNAAAEAGDEKYVEKLTSIAAPHGLKVEVSLPLVFPNDWPTLGDWAQPLAWKNGHDGLVQEVILHASGSVTLRGNFDPHNQSSVIELPRRLTRLPQARSLRVPVRAPLSQAEEKQPPAAAAAAQPTKAVMRPVVVNGDPAQLGGAE